MRAIDFIYVYIPFHMPNASCTIGLTLFSSRLVPVHDLSFSPRIPLVTLILREKSHRKILFCIQTTPSTAPIVYVHRRHHSSTIVIWKTMCSCNLELKQIYFGWLIKSVLIHCMDFWTPGTWLLLSCFEIAKLRFLFVTDFDKDL